MSLQHGGRVRHKKGHCPSRLGFRWVLFPPHGDVISIAHTKTSNIALSDALSYNFNTCM
jgi:hypothetical protein